MKQKVLLIDDDAVFRRIATQILEQSPYEIIEAETGEAALSLVLQDQPDLILLDIALPGLNGMEICDRLKSSPRTAHIPVIVLTGNVRQGQEIACLDLGADDYLTKPMDGERLLARCRAVLRRSPPKNAAKPNLRLGALSLNYVQKTVAFRGKVFTHLTPREFSLLYEIACLSPNPCDRVTLYRRLWGMEPPSESSLRTVDVHARRIRLKLGLKPNEWLKHVSGRGYCLEGNEGADAC